MMIKTFFTLAALALIPLSAPSSAAAQDVQGSDMRLRTLDYNPASVVRLDGCLNFQTMITFADDEHIENVGLGDSAQWQVMPNKRGNLLFVKPLIPRAFSNMTVVSDKRVYNFELRAASPADCDHGRVVYDLHFRYPAETKGTVSKPKSDVDNPDAFLPPVEKRNAAYTYSGAVELVPLRAFDDGTSTYMRWADGISTPAIYALNSDGSESIVNYAARGDYLVIEQIAKAFVLRRGELKAVVYDDAYHLQGLDADSPQPRGKNQAVIK